MNKIHRIFGYGLLVVIAGLLVLLLEITAEDDSLNKRNKNVLIEWDMPTTSSSANYYSECLRLFADTVYERTGGKVVIHIHYGGALGYAGTEMVSVVRDGLVPIADMVKHAQSGEESFLSMTALPYLAPDFSRLRMLQLFSQPVEHRLLEAQNQKVLFQVPRPGQIVYTRKPIHGIEDLKGLRMRVVSRGDSQMFTQLGATPVQMQEGEVITSLATGLIDGVIASSSAGTDGKYWELTSYAGIWNWHSSGNMVTVNKTVFEALPNDLRQVIEDTAKELEPVFARRAIQVDWEAQKVLQLNGMTLYNPGDELMEEIMKVSLGMWEHAKQQDPRVKQVITDYLNVMNWAQTGGESVPAELGRN